jgi:hypothetical protein
MKPLERFLHLLTVSAAIGVVFAVSVPPFLQIVNYGTQTDRWWYAALFVFPYSVLVSVVVNNPFLSLSCAALRRQSQVSYRITFGI